MIHISTSLRTLLQASNCKVGELFLTSEKLLEVGNYFSFRESGGTISYCPIGKEQTFGEGGVWLRANRVDIRPGKLIKKLFGSSQNPLPDTEIELFVNRFKSLEEKDTEFQIAKTGQEINDVYGRANVESCMKGYPVGNFYSQVGAELLYLTKNGEIIGRALLWNKVVSNVGEVKFMDRIYGRDHVIEMFRNYARDNGYYTLDIQHYHQSIASLDDKKVYIQRVDVKFPDARFYPYMDTFYSAESTCLLADDEGEYWLNNTNGSCEREDEHEGQVYSEYYDTWIDEDDAIMVNNDYYYSEDCVECEKSGRYILRDEAYQVELPGRSIYIHSDYVIQL